MMFRIVLRFAGILAAMTLEDTQRQRAERLKQRLLAERLKKDDDGAFNLFASSYREKVFNRVRRIVSNDDDAEDVTQIVFMESFTSIGSLRNNETLVPWLMRIATNQANNFIRTHGKHSKNRESLPQNDSDGDFQDPLSNAADPQPGPENLAIDAERSEAAVTAIMNLPLGFRAICIMRFLKAMSYADIQAASGLPMGTVKSRINRGRDLLRRELEQYE